MSSFLNRLCPTTPVLRAWLGLTLLLLPGCATITVKRLKNDSEYTDGVRFYRPSPHLLLKRTAAKVADKDVLVYDASLVMLPDYSQEYVITWCPGLGSVTPQFGLDAGWTLTRLDSKVESGAAGTLQGIAGILGAVLPTLQPAEVRAGERVPGLYPLSFRDGRWQVEWDKAVVQFSF